MTSPKVSQYDSIFASIDNPRLPARIPVKNTKAMPSEMPHTRSFPNAKPSAQMMEIIINDCSAE